jgi:Na+-transporting methylmalonyl-CoA/oxaloacetate decarboxylase gamma subunit
MILLSINSQTWIITIVGWLIVFAALVLLVIVFNQVPKFFRIKFNRINKTKSKENNNEQANDNKYITGDETAAIAMAIHMFFEEQHDEESNIITIKRIARRYSPWSSKIYGVMNFPK